MKTLVTAALSSLVLVASAGGAGANASYADPAEDQIGAAPDITAVEVTNTLDGVVTFRVTIANYPVLPPLTAVGIVLDVDRNPRTGDGDGLETGLVYAVDMLGDPVRAVLRWEDDDIAEVHPFPSGVSIEFADGALTAIAPRSELLHTTEFGFVVVTVSENSEGDIEFDVAPDDVDLWSFDLVLPPPRLVPAKPFLIPPRPVAGQRVAVTSIVARTDRSPTAKPIAVACSAHAGRAVVRARGRFLVSELGEGKAQCVLNVPRAARGALVRGRITLSVEGVSVAVPFGFRVH